LKKQKDAKDLTPRDKKKILDDSLAKYDKHLKNKYINDECKDKWDKKYGLPPYSEENGSRQYRLDYNRYMTDCKAIGNRRRQGILTIDEQKQEVASALEAYSQYGKYKEEAVARGNALKKAKNKKQ